MPANPRDQSAHGAPEPAQALMFCELHLVGDRSQ